MGDLDSDDSGKSFAFLYSLLSKKPYEPVDIILLFLEASFSIIAA